MSGLLRAKEVLYVHHQRIIGENISLQTRVSRIAVQYDIEPLGRQDSNLRESQENRHSWDEES